MAYACFNCGKKKIRGTQHRHHPGVAGRQHLRRAPHTLKVFKPNLHSAYLKFSDGYRKVLLCSKCRRLLKKQGKIKSWEKQEKKELTPKPTSKTPVLKEEELLAKAEIKKSRRGKKIKTEDKEKIVSVEEIIGRKKSG